MRLVLVESPYANPPKDDPGRHRRYLIDAMKDCLDRGEAPLAMHGLLTHPGLLDDSVPADRQLGILVGFAWGAKAEATVVYTDLGISPGMRLGIDAAKALYRHVEYRRLADWNWVPGPAIFTDS